MLRLKFTIYTLLEDRFMNGAFILGIAALWGWACYSIAKSKNRNKELWTVLGVLFGIFAVIVVSVLPNLPS